MNNLQSAIDKVRDGFIPHVKFNTAHQQMLKAIEACEPGEVVCLAGPSRVGKSRVLDKVSDTLIGNPAYYPEGKMPIVRVFAENQKTDGAFSTKTFMVRALEAIEHPFFGSPAEDDPWGTKYHRMLDKTTEGVLTGAFKQAVALRASKYIMVDEAHHVSYARGGPKTATAILDSWKCLAASTKVVLVLAGTNELSDLLLESTHMSGRSQFVHFPRYREEKGGVPKAFDYVLEAYDEVIPLAEDIGSLLRINQMLFEGSFGCVGHLNKWLRKALADALSRGSDCLSITNLRRTRLPADHANKILTDISTGEKTFNKKFGNVSEEPPKKPKEEEPKKTNNKPFQTKPKRYTNKKGKNNKDE